VEVATTPAALSQNINLFQSLRVLQEGENGEDASALTNSECNRREVLDRSSVPARLAHPRRGRSALLARDNR